MEDMFSVSTSGMGEVSNSILDYSRQLEQLLSDFDSVMVRLTSEGLQGGMDDSAFNAYSTVKTSLDEYCANIAAVGTSVGNVAERTANASKLLSDAIGA